MGELAETREVRAPLAAEVMERLALEDQLRRVLGDEIGALVVGQLDVDQREQFVSVVWIHAPGLDAVRYVKRKEAEDRLDTLDRADAQHLDERLHGVGDGRVILGLSDCWHRSFSERLLRVC